MILCGWPFFSPRNEQYSLWRLEICTGNIMQELIRAFDERWIRGRTAMRDFGGNLAQPAQLSTKLFDNKLDHPDSFMKGMADFFFNCAQCCLFASKLRFHELQIGRAHV